MEFVESGRTPARRATGDETFDDAAHGVAFTLDLEDELRHAFGRRGVGTTHVVAVDLVEVEVVVVFVEHNGTYLPRPGGDAHPELSQEDLCKRPAHHTAHGFAGRTASAAAMVANAVFALVGEIGVGGSENVAQVVVVGGVVLGVAHEKSDGGAGGAALKDAGEKFDLIGFAAWGGEAALSRSAAVELVLNEIGVDVDAGGHAVDDAAHADAVAFAEGGEAEELSEGVHGVGDERRGPMRKDGGGEDPPPSVGASVGKLVMVMMTVVAATASAAIVMTVFMVVMATAVVVAVLVVVVAATAAATFAREHIDGALDFGIGGGACRYDMSLVVKLLAGIERIEVDDHHFVFDIDHEAIEAVALFVDQGEHGAGIDGVFVEAAVDVEGRFGHFDDALLFVGAVAFIDGEGEVERVAFVEVAHTLLKTVERHAEMGDELEGMCGGGLFELFVDAGFVVGVEGVGYGDVAVLLCVHWSKGVGESGEKQKRENPDQTSG